MRVREMLVLGALTIGAMACGDSLAPPASEGRDLEFVLPAAKGELPTAQGYRTWDEPVTAAEIAKVEGMRQASLVDGDGNEIVPLILSTYAIGEFNDYVFRIQYGMWGFGSGYTMTPHVRIVGQSGDVLIDQLGLGRSEDAPIYWYMRPHVEESFNIPTSCGAVAQVKVQFEVRVGLPFASFAKTQSMADKTTYQARCPTLGPSPEGGGGGSGTIERIVYGTICYFEVWVNQYGVVVDVFLIACYELSGPILMV